jgi:2-oxoglutarate ferredoxin oxidoreductase subunit alpha
MQSRWCSHGDYELVVLTPMTVQEMFDLTIEAFNLSEHYRIPVILLTDETVAHARERLVIPSYEAIKVINRKKPKVPPHEYASKKPDEDLVPPMACFGEGYYTYVTGLTHDEKGVPNTEDPEVHSTLVRRLCDKIRKNSHKIVKTEGYMLQDAETVIVAYGVVCRSAISAAELGRRHGLKLGVLRLVTIWPFPDEAVQKAAESSKAILVPEMNYGQLVREVERAAKGMPVYSIPKLGGEIHTPQEILEAVRRFQQ